jgi:hypothetical protein
VTDTTERDPLDVSAKPIPLPQTGALTPQDEDVESLAAPPDMGKTIAEHQIAAGQVNHGDARDWAENTVAGVQAALAGFGAAGKVNPGSGALAGVGAAARQGQERRDELNKEKSNRAQRQQQIDLEQQRVTNEKTSQDRDYQLRVAENARQQAESVAKLAEHDKRMREMDDAHTHGNMLAMHEDITFRQNQVDHEDTLKSLGAKPMQIAGQETPAFDDLGQLEQYANQNGLAKQAHLNGYRERPVLGADNKYHIYQVPDAGPEWHTVKDADGKTTKIFGDPLSVLNYQEKVAQTRDFNSQTSLRYAEAKQKLEDFKDQGTVKAARKALDKVGGDYTKLEEGQKEALRGDAMKQYQFAWNVSQAAQRDMQKDPDWFSVPVDAQGNPDRNSSQFKEIAKRYHVEDADAELGDAYDTLRKLGHGYNAPGGRQAAPPAGGWPTAPSHGAPITQAAAAEFMRLAEGNPEKAKALAIAAGWGPPGAAAPAEENPAEVGAGGYGQGAARTIR